MFVSTAVTWAPSDEAADIGPALLWPSEEIGLPVVAGRYQLLEILGQGGFGQVWLADDLLAGDQVALKLLDVDDVACVQRARAEITALRRLRLPGVVGFCDDGEHDRQYFVVMELVRGRPLCRPTEPTTWHALEGLFRELVEVLARVHLAGVVHRDLKPDNVLLDSDDRVVLVDFGLATGGAIAPEVHGPVAGTVRYIAPEQLQGLAVDGRTDLYSLGVMLFEALAGRPPHQGTTMAELLRARLGGPAPPLATAAPHAPPAVAALVDRLLARDPAQRPGSALELLAALGGRAPLLDGAALTALPADRSATPDELRSLFAGPDLFFHLVEDGAAVLHRRTGGDRTRIAEELDAWLRAGLAYWERDRVVVDRVALRRLQAEIRLGLGRPLPDGASADATTLLGWCRRAWPDARPQVLAAATGWTEARVASAASELRALGRAWHGPAGQVDVRPVTLAVSDPGESAAHLLLAATSPHGSLGRLRHLQAAGATPTAVLDEALATIDHLRLEGRVGDALAALASALSLARAHHQESVEARLLTHLVKVCLARETRDGADLALYELGRSTVRGPGQQRMERLVRAWRAVVDADSARAIQHLLHLEPFGDEELDVWRGAVRMNVARLQSRRAWEAELDAMESWARAGGIERLAKWQGWLGNLRYAQGRFKEAGALHRRAVLGKRSQDARLASMIDAAWDLLDAQELAEAVEVAEQARATARRLDHPEYEAQAVTVLRSAGYRSGRPLRAQPALVAAAEALGPGAAGLLGMFEAAIAWRGDELDLAGVLAVRAQADLERAGMDAGARLMAALRVALGHELDVMALVSRSLAGQVPAIDVQVLGLVARHDPGLVRSHRTDLFALAAHRPTAEWPHRREILSIAEALL